MGEDSREGGRAAGTPNRVIGKVIKAEAESALSEKVSARRGGVLNAEEFDAHKRARAIVVEAEKRAEHLKAEALRFRDEVFAKAKEEAKADVQAWAAEVLARAKMQAGQMLEGAQRDAVALAMTIAERIIGRDLERDPSLVLEISATALEAVRNAKAMVLRVHPDDGQILREKRPRLMELIGRSVDLSIRDDATVARGGCVIQTEFGTIDGQIRTQFEMLRAVLMPADAKKEVK